ncbi:MAG: serine/threonine-protein kinase, partial [Planctomycetota bacterium]
QLSPGDQLGRYRVLEGLGEGTFSHVYKAQDLELDRFVAIKVPMFQESATRECVQSFFQEAKTLAKLQHPLIVGIHDVISDESGSPMLVLEYVEGQRFDLENGICDETLHHLIEVAEALDYAHRLGFVHRDLKPQNILIRDDGNAVLIDFGLSMSLARRSEPDNQGISAGTFAFMSPEQARGETLWTDGRADIWALGVILYRLLTGCMPFREESRRDMLRAIVHQKVTPPSQIAANVPDALEKLCLQCLQKSPDDRLTSASRFAEVIRRYQRGEKPSSISLQRTVLIGLATCAIGLLLVDRFVPIFPRPQPNAAVADRNTQSLQSTAPQLQRESETNSSKTTKVSPPNPDGRPAYVTSVSMRSVASSSGLMGSPVFLGQCPAGEKIRIEFQFDNDTGERLDIRSFDCQDCSVESDTAWSMPWMHGEQRTL